MAEEAKNLTPEKMKEWQQFMTEWGRMVAAAEKTQNALKDLALEMTDQKPVNVVLMEALDSSRGQTVAEAEKTQFKREVCIFALAAIDEVNKLLDVLSNDSPALFRDRDTATFALRNWLSRGPDQSKLLYNEKDKTGRLLDNQRFNDTEANIILTLLHEFSPTDSRSKETFQVLVGYLRNSKLIIRQLAFSHLGRLVPPGLAPPYNPIASEDDRERMVKEWQKLLDEGKLPPRFSEPMAQPMSPPKSK